MATVIPLVLDSDGQAAEIGTGDTVPIDVLPVQGGVTPDIYGDSSHVPVITVNAQGIITALTLAMLSGGGGGMKYALVQHRTAPSVPGGTAVSTRTTVPQTVALNEIVFDTIGLSLSSNQVTVPGGKFYILFGQGVSFATDNSAMYVYDVTNNLRYKGSPIYPYNSSGLGASSIIATGFVLTAEAIMERQFHTYTPQSGNGFGYPNGGLFDHPEDNIYAFLLFIAFDIP